MLLLCGCGRPAIAFRHERLRLVSAGVLLLKAVFRATDADEAGERATSNLTQGRKA
jgi:hypothetical protein